MTPVEDEHMGDADVLPMEGGEIKLTPAKDGTANEEIEEMDDKRRCTILSGDKDGMIPHDPEPGDTTCIMMATEPEPTQVPPPLDDDTSSCLPKLIQPDGSTTTLDTSTIASTMH